MDDSIEYTVVKRSEHRQISRSTSEAIRQRARIEQLASEYWLIEFKAADYLYYLDWVEWKFPFACGGRKRK